MTQNYIERYWRDAKPEDAIKEPPMVARFRDINYPWKINTLLGVRQGAEFPWFSESKGSFQQCQVYDAPDPGEGWRLVDPDSDSYNQDGIEFWYPAFKLWFSRRSFGRDKQPFEMDNATYYRIRIEPPNPEPKYVPFTWEDREQLRGRWIMDGTGEQEYTINDLFNDSGVLYICGHPAEHFLNWNWTFVDTGEPVGRKVAQ